MTSSSSLLWLLTLKSESERSYKNRASIKVTFLNLSIHRPVEKKNRIYILLIICLIIRIVRFRFVISDFSHSFSLRIEIKLSLTLRIQRDNLLFLVRNGLSCLSGQQETFMIIIFLVCLINRWMCALSIYYPQNYSHQFYFWFSIYLN